MLMFIVTGWAEGGFLGTVMSYAAVYGGAGQFVAGILEIIKGNTFGGTAFCSYGCFWLGWYEMNTMALEHGGEEALTGMTLWNALWAVLTFGFFIVTLRKNICLQTIFSTLTVTFALLAGGVHNQTCNKVAGYVGFVCGTSAIYAALAMLYEEDDIGLKVPGLDNWKCLEAKIHHAGRDDHEVHEVRAHVILPSKA